jgi:hypothetical protein
MLGPASCLLLAAFSSSAVEGAFGVSGEVAAGRAPLDYSGPEQNSLTLTLIPGVAAQLRTKDSTLTLSYTPRVFYRIPNTLNINHPLVLHQVGLDHVLALGKWLSWTTNLQLAVGQIDYTAAGVVFDPSQVAQVRTSVTDILRTTAQTGLKYQVRPTFALHMEGGVEYTTTLDEATVRPTMDPNPPADAMAGTGTQVFGSVIPDSFQVRGKPGFAVSVGRTTHVGGAAEVTYQWFKSIAKYLVLSPELDWDTTFGQRTTLALSGGLAYVWTLDAIDPKAKNNSLGGTGSIDLKSLVYRGQGLSTTLGLNAALDWFFDPVIATSQPRAGATATGLFQIGRKWQISPLASIYTLLKTTTIRLTDMGVPLPPDDPRQIQAELDRLRAASNATLIRFELPIDYQISEVASFGFGGRAALRARSVADSNFRLGEQVEIWGFVGLTLRAATSADKGNWLPL